MKLTRFVLLIALYLLAGFVKPVARSIRVPADYRTIQQAINAANDGDSILVAPGTYVETIDFLGKAIAISSESGPQVTIIDGDRAGPVVSAVSGETLSSSISGFTIQNGFARSGPIGGGISVYNSSLRIFNNVITRNDCFDQAGGIALLGSNSVVTNNTISFNSAPIGVGITINGGAPLIQGNIISDNFQQFGFLGIGGGGISIGASDAQIIENTISNNKVASSPGGGITLFSAGSPVIRGNIISGNICGSDGGGIFIVNDSNPLIVQNLIVGNVAKDVRGFGRGGGIFWSLPFVRGPIVLNNTIADNDSPTGSGIYADGIDDRTELTNNLIIAKERQTAFYCGNFDQTIPILRFNNIFSRRGTAYGGICPNKTGIDGNISSPDLLKDPANGDYHLLPGSPSVDAGINVSSGLTDLDLGRNPRFVDGNGDGAGTVDIGAYEKQLPKIVTVTIDGKNLLLTGLGFNAGSAILMNGVKQKTIFDEQTPDILIGKKVAKTIPSGQSVLLQVRDSDGAFSPAVEFRRP